MSSRPSESSESDSGSDSDSDSVSFYTKTAHKATESASMLKTVQHAASATVPAFIPPDRAEEKEHKLKVGGSGWQS